MALGLRTTTPDVRRPSEETPRGRAWVVGLCFAAIVFDGYDLIVYGSVVPALLDQWSLTPQQAGDIGSYALVGMFAGALAVGPLTDRFGRRALFAACLTWFSTAMLVVATAPNPEVLGAARFLAGLGFGGVVPTAIALTVEWAPAGRRSLYNAVMLSGFPAGGILAAVLAINLLEDRGFRVLFAFGAVPLVTIVPLALRFLPESPDFQPSRKIAATPKRPTKRPKGLLTLLKGGSARAAWVFAAANFCSMLLVYGLNTWLPQIMRRAGYPLGSALTFLLVLNIGAIVGGVSGSFLADRIGSRRVATAGLLTCALCVSLLGSHWPIVALYLLVAAVGATGVGSQMVLFGYVATHFAPDARVTALGFTTGIGRLGAVCGPILGGHLLAWQVGTNWNFRVYAAVALIGALCARAVPPSTRRPDTGAAMHDGAPPSPALAPSPSG
jgi:AAHS family benzoate transporter-like MFS transporter